MWAVPYMSFCVNDSSGQVHCQGGYVLTLGEVAFCDALWIVFVEYDDTWLIKAILRFRV